VLAVIGFHLFGWPGGGYLGVDAFFVVSGFVITGVLVRERDRTGRISLRAFWIRRARRILPLALLVIVAVVVVAPWAWAGAKVASVRGDALWATLFAANWHYAARADTYFDTGSAPSPLLHYWSLGVEEQFYVAWPLLVVLAVAGFVRAAPGTLQRVGLGLALIWALGFVILFLIVEVFGSWNGDIVGLLRELSPGGIIFFLASLIALIGTLTRFARS
jgi:peptidoglycan/LPS O-acetylase OafA/YrhL